MAKIFKIILTTIRIIYRVIRIPFGFGFIILGILFSSGMIDDPVSGSEINYFMMILIGGVLLGIGGKKKKEELN